jgi:ADP-ribose pyrophosphatase YjhB (NUDIX family)
MHLIIANQMTKRLPVKNKQAFIMGGVAPDAAVPKDLSHFYAGNHSDYTRCIDYAGFLEKYRAYQDSDYLLGYYCHLIADDIWLKGFYMPWLKNRLEVDRDLFHNYHQDFRLLNGKLLKHYGLKEFDFENVGNFVLDLDEVKLKDVEAFIPALVADLEYGVDSLDAELSVFTLEQIIGYIETSVEKSIWHLEHVVGAGTSNQDSVISGATRLSNLPPKHFVSVSGYITNAAGEVLLVRNFHRADTMEMPGGQVEEGETLEEAMHREIFEEPGVKVRLDGITGIYQNIKSGVVCVVFRGEYLSGELRPAEGETAEVIFAQLTKENADEYITRPNFKNRAIDAMEPNYIPFEAFSIRPYELICRYEAKLV